MNAASNNALRQQSRLRERAQTRLQTPGTTQRIAPDASMALRVLFDLASSPDTAHDALALLHELQVHQVEMDLQNEELQSSRLELESAWARQIQMHEASPSAQIVLDTHGHFVECNAQALQCLNQGLMNLSGQRLEHWLAAVDVPRIQAWLAQAQSSQEPMSLCFTLRTKNAAERPVCAAARANPVTPGVLVAWVDAPATNTCGSAA